MDPDREPFGSLPNAAEPRYSKRRFPSLRPIMRLKPIIALMGLTLSMVGCDWPLGLFTVCEDYAAPSLAITILDSINSGPVFDALVWVEDGAFVDTLPGGNGVSSGPIERPGRYDIYVEHPDYLPWQEKGVRVKEDECHVITRSVEARLQHSG